MTIEEIEIGKFAFDIVTERVTDVEVSRNLYNLLELEDGEGGYYNTHRGIYNINNLIEDIEEYGLGEYNISEDDVELLRACKTLFDDGEVDAINFIEEK